MKLKMDSEGIAVVKTLVWGPTLSGKSTYLTILKNIKYLESPKSILSFKKLDDASGLTLFFDEMILSIGMQEKNGKPSLKHQIMTVPGRKGQSMQREILIDGTNALIIFLDGDSRAFEENKSALIHLKELLGTQLMNNDLPFRIIVNKEDLPVNDRIADWQISQLFLETGYTFDLSVFQNKVTRISCKNASMDLQELLKIPDKSSLLTEHGTLKKSVRPTSIKNMMVVEEILPEIIDGMIANIA